MKLDSLFIKQKELDRHIEIKKGLEGQDLLNHKLVALQVELGELLNEWRGFKFWSNDQSPRKDAMLEEYVDCLHFVLSIGNDLGVLAYTKYDYNTGNIMDQFMDISREVNRIYMTHKVDFWKLLADLFLTLGDMLGFTPAQIINAYYDKNKVNHARQVQGY